MEYDYLEEENDFVLNNKKLNKNKNNKSINNIEIKNNKKKKNSKEPSPYNSKYVRKVTNKLVN